MARIRMQKPKKIRKRSRSQAPLENIVTAAAGSSELLESVERMLEEIDQVLQEAGQT